MLDSTMFMSQTVQGHKQNGSRKADGGLWMKLSCMAVEAASCGEGSERKCQVRNEAKQLIPNKAWAEGRWATNQLVRQYFGQLLESRNSWAEIRREQCFLQLLEASSTACPHWDAMKHCPKQDSLSICLIIHRECISVTQTLLWFVVEHGCNCAVVRC